MHRTDASTRQSLPADVEPQLDIGPLSETIADPSADGSSYIDFDMIGCIHETVAGQRRPMASPERRERRFDPDAVEGRQQRLLRDRRWSRNELDDDPSRSWPGPTRVERPSVRPGRIWPGRLRPVEPLPTDPPAALPRPSPGPAHGGGRNRVRLLTPDLTGLDLLSARALAAECGLDIAVTLTEAPAARPGSVATQWPEAGTPVRLGGRIQVVVARSAHIVGPG